MVMASRCCCCSIRVGIRVISVFMMIFATFAIINTAIKKKDLDERSWNETDEQRYIHSFVNGVLIAALVTEAITFLVSALLLVPACGDPTCRGLRWWMMPFIVWMYIRIGLTFSVLIRGWSVISAQPYMLVIVGALVASICVMLYFVVMVQAYFKFISIGGADDDAAPPYSTMHNFEESPQTPNNFYKIPFAHPNQQPPAYEATPSKPTTGHVV